MEATYKVSELAAKARQMFDTTPEVVSVALQLGGKDSYTVDEAKQIVNDFLNKEVK